MLSELKRFRQTNIMLSHVETMFLKKKRRKNRRRRRSKGGRTMQEDEENQNDGEKLREDSVEDILYNVYYINV